MVPESAKAGQKWTAGSRRMAIFAQYALAAAGEALEDAQWHPEDEMELEATVRVIPTLTVAYIN